MEAEDRQRYLHDLAELGITMEDVKRCTRNSTASASRAKSAYLYFCSLKREEIRAQNCRRGEGAVRRRIVVERHQQASQCDLVQHERRGTRAVRSQRVRRQGEDKAGGGEGASEVGSPCGVDCSIKDGVVVPTSKPKRMKRARTSYTLFYKEKMAQLRGENESGCDVWR